MVKVNSILKLKPFYSEKIWGYEKWNLSTHKNGHSMVEGSDNTLGQLIDRDIKIIIKIIQANETLSVQVHPDDNYANKYENDSGKTECWYVLDCKEDASLICGIKDGYDRKSFREVIERSNIEENLKEIKVKKGDMIYIPSGTVHAIKGGLKIIEVQQSSDITYRIYDWGRNREVHIDKSIDVIDYSMKNLSGKIENFKKFETPYFTLEEILVETKYEDEVKRDFYAYTVVDGQGFIESNSEKIFFEKEDTIYIGHGCKYRIEGKIKLLKTYI